MAAPSDEEKSFLSSNSIEAQKHPRRSGGIRGWSSNMLSPQNRRVTFMGTVVGFVMIWFLWTCVSFLNVNRHFLTNVPRSRRNPNESIIKTPSSCDDKIKGYTCQPETSHSWGQYSPYFKVPSDISADLPAQCLVTFAQILSRHGARDPTVAKSASYAQTIEKIKKNVQDFTGAYLFLEEYNYDLGADQLTVFGEHEMVNSGIAFFEHYQSLSNISVPFFRASGEQRVVESAQRFGQGFHQAKLAVGGTENSPYPYDIVIINESRGSNNT